MSKRPKQANAVMSRLRRPATRLRDLPIWSKLGLIMLVPTLATVIVGVNGLVDHIGSANNAERTRTLSVLSQAAGGLVDHLQNERAYGVMIYSTRAGTPDRAAAVKLYTDEHTYVDAAKVPYAQQRASLSDLPANVDTLLVRLDRNLEELPAVRSAYANANKDRGLAGVEGTYNDLINDLLNVRDASAQLATDTSLSDHLRAVAAVARAKDYMAQQRDAGHKAIFDGDFNVAHRREFLVTEAGYQISTATLAQVGTNEEKALYNRVVSGPSKFAATNLSGTLQALQGANTTQISFGSDKWEAAFTAYNKLFRAVETRMDTDIVAQATNLRDDVNRQVFIETSVLLLLLLLAIVFAWLVARSMARSLRELRQGALSVAQYGLPQAVERLRDPALMNSMTPAQVADQVAEPLPVRSRDEFGQVTEAFNAVHLEAVRTAAEQAALRSSVATMFVNLARRSQILVDRLIGHLDRLERGEEDPDRLAELFQLDHLATRMRRNDENLLVLAGADSTRVQREPAALIDVLRAAQSEVEHYTRIEFGMIDRDIEVSAHAVNDMVHLVAELFDNATAFSPPNSTVLVEARRMGDSAILSVEDRGIGISREQLRDLNERLANPPMVDVAVSRMMGLVVVARLANRHGVSVELRPAETERGTIADVGLPLGVLVLNGNAGRLQPGSTTFGGGGIQQQPAQRSPFAEPLALESGNGGYPAGRPFDPNPPMPTGGMLGTAGGRSVPAWSDLTGAPSNGFGNGANGSHNGTNGGGTNGSGGPNGFRGPRSNEPMPPIPQSPSPQGMGMGPQGFSGPEGLPQRRTGGEGQRPDDTGSFTIPRQLPSNPEHQGRPPFVPPVSAPPLPPASAPPAPYGGGRPGSSSPASGPPYPAQNSAPSAPPAWPPVAADNTGGHPAVPESLAASLDMTAEIPRFRGERFTTGSQPRVDPQSAPPAQDRPQTVAERSAAAAAAAHEAAAQQAAAAQATAAQQIAAAQAAARQRQSDGNTQYADETMELPIFRELESAWFTTTNAPSTAPTSAAPASAAPAAAQAPVAEPVSTADDLITTQRFSTAQPASRPVLVPQQATSPESPEPDRRREMSRERDTASVGAGASNGNGNGSNPWHTAADEGWQAARAASEVPVETTTTAGLPKRTPMAQLVPGGVDRAGPSVQRRTPEAVRGLLSAYHRGVQRGRQSTNPEETSGGQQSGKEHEA